MICIVTMVVIKMVTLLVLLRMIAQKKKMFPEHVSQSRLQSYTIRWCHNPSVFARANTLLNNHLVNVFDQLPTLSDRLGTRGCSVHSALNGCLFHWPSLNVTTL